MKQHHSPLALYRQELKKHSYFKQLFHTYALVSAALFLLFSVLITYYVNDDYRHTLTDMQERSISRAYQLNQSVLQDIASSCFKIMEDADMSALLYSADYTATMGLQGREIYDQMKQTSSLIHSLYFINFRTNTILDAYSRSPIETHYDQTLLTFLQEHTPSIAFYCGLPRWVSRGPKFTAQRVFSLIIHTSKLGAIVVNIDCDTYEEMIQLESSDYINILEVCGDGDVLISSDPDLWGTNVNDDATYTKITEHVSKSGSFQEGSSLLKNRIAYLHNSGMNLTYYSVFNQNALYTTNHLIWVVLLYGICFIAVGLLVTFGVSIIVYKPFRNFKEKLTNSPALAEAAIQTADMDDFTYLSGIYQNITAANANLQAMSNNWIKEKDRITLKRLMTNGSNANQIYPQEYEALNQYFCHTYSQIVVINIDFSSRQKEDSGGIGLLRYSISNVFNELMESKVLFINMDMFFPSVIYFVNHDDATNETLRSILLEGQEFMQNTFNITLSIGVGERVSDLDELSLSNRSAQDALNRRFLTGDGSIHFADELSLPSPAAEHYPYELDSAVIAALKNTDFDAFSNALADLFNIIRQFHLDQTIRSILQLEVAMQRFENANELMVQTLPWEIAILTQLDINTIQNYLLNRGKQDIEELAEIKSHSNEKPELIQTILELVDSNLSNPNLSVVFLAGEVHLSVNYLRSIFKENTGDSLSNYIIQKKLELICHLLADTNTSLQDISDQLGFSTKNYFFTFFKKHMGTTPNEYRKEKKQNEQ